MTEPQVVPILPLEDRTSLALLEKKVDAISQSMLSLHTSLTTMMETLESQGEAMDRTEALVAHLDRRLLVIDVLLLATLGLVIGGTLQRQGVVTLGVYFGLVAFFVVLALVAYWQYRVAARG